jgi:hypothetical protein
LGSVSRQLAFLAFLTLAPLGGCATVSVYEAVSAEVSLTEDQSELRKAADAYCKIARDKGLATGEASLTALADMLTGNNDNAGAYWKKIGADKAAPASTVTRVRADLNASAKGLTDLTVLANSLLKTTKPTRSDVQEFERALIHARQSRDSFSDALVQANKRSEREYQILLELGPMDAALAKARSAADELAAVRAQELSTAQASS